MINNTRPLLDTIILSIVRIAVFILFFKGYIFGEMKHFTLPPQHLLEVYFYDKINVPVPEADSWQWNPYNSVGLGISFPVGFKSMSLSFEGDAGILKGHGNNTLEIDLVMMRAMISYTLHKKDKKWGLMPSIGLTNLMMRHSKGNIFSGLKKGEVFKNVENEFGVALAFKPYLLFKKFRFAVPVSYHITFSSPKIYHSADLSISLGYCF